MIEWLFRKEILSKVDDKEKEYARLLKDKYKMDLLALILVATIIILPFSLTFSVVTYVILKEKTIWDIVLGVIMVNVVGIGMLYFVKRFKNEIMRFKTDIAINMYVKRYLKKGNAITTEDFNMIEKNNEKLYYVITRLMANGYCYSVCYDLLATLKKRKYVICWCIK